MRHVWMLEKEEAARALELLDRALEIDSDYPLALALAGWCWAQRSVYGWSPDRSASIAEALRLAERAARAGGDDPLTLTVLGAVHTITRNHETARVILERALSIDPNSAWAWSRYGWLDVYTGHVESGERSLRRSIRLSPLDPMLFNNHAALGLVRAIARDFDGAVDYLQLALRERPGANWIRRILTACLVGAGQLKTAREMASELLNHQPDFTIKGYLDAVPSTAEFRSMVGELLSKLDLPPG